MFAVRSRWNSIRAPGRLNGLSFRKFDRYDPETGKRPTAQGHAVSTTRGEDEFKRRFLDQFQDTAFSSLQAELNKMADAAWDGYSHSRKSPRTRRAGEGYADPDYALAHAWINAADAVHAALRAHRDDAEHRILLINASPRSEHTCPGEMSKSYRLAQMAQSVFLDEHARVDLLDLSRLSSEYGRQIHPCKACFSTSPALCHWPCSCYPNHSLGQVHDWMNEIYPRWVAAHGGYDSRPSTGIRRRHL